MVPKKKSENPAIPDVLSHEVIEASDENLFYNCVLQPSHLR